MKANMRGTVAALACALTAGSFLVPPASAQTTTLMDILFGNQPRRSSLERQRPMQEQGAFSDDWRQRQAAEMSEPQPVVRGPTYRTYRADQFERLDLAGLSDPITTGSVDPVMSEDVEAGLFRAAVGQIEDMELRALPEVGSAVREFYKENPRFIWSDADGISDRARDAQSVLSNADSVGLSLADYAVVEPRVDGTREERLAEKARFEIEMAVATLTYILDATRGRIDPNRISGYHDFKRKDVDLVRAMRVLASTSTVGNYLERRSPGNEEFRTLVSELERLQKEELEKDRIVIEPDTFVRPGGRTSEMPKVVAAIEARSSDALKVEHALTLTDYDGGEEYTPALVALVESFQSETGLASDGIIGPNTILAMTGISNADKMRKVRLAMERMRWMNHDLGERHVMINTPAYSVTYSEKGRPDLTMRAVVGTKANQTYFFQDRIERVEFNPYWGVPRSIIVNEMLPKLRQDPAYLDRQGYEVTTRSGARIPSSSVNWYSVGSDVSYNVRQPPGPGNALGELKIMFPNSHAIYMHDTPARDLFSRDSRAYSHGCVRLEDPRAMAAAVMGVRREAVDEHVASGRNHSVSVDADIPVYVAYFTAWPDESGTVNYYRDVYDRDMYLERAIAATEAVRHAGS